MTVGELSVYDRMDDPIKAMDFLGNAIAESGIFGCTNKQQGIVLAWECLATKEPALTLAKKNHIISNKLSMKSDAMLAEFAERGGKHKVIERTPDLCSIEFTSKDGIVYPVSITWEAAQCEPFPYYNKGKSEDDIIDEIALWKAGKTAQPKLKAKYRTPRSRMQMLSARLVSDSVRFIDPGVNFGRYAPEEIDDDPEDNGHAATERRPRKSAKQVMEEAAAAAGAGDVIDATCTVSATQPDVAAPPAQPSQQSSSTNEAVQLITHSQVERIRNLFAVLGVNGDAQNEILRKKGVSSLRSLTFAQAEELLLKLQDVAKAAAQQAESDQGQSPSLVESSPVTSIEVDGPCTAEQVATIKTLGAEIEQLQPGISAKIVEKIKAAGLTKLADMTFNEARTLEQALRLKNLAAFFDASLKGFKPGN